MSGLRRLSADDPDEVPKHINTLSTGIHELHKYRLTDVVAAFAVHLQDRGVHARDQTVTH